MQVEDKREGKGSTPPLIIIMKIYNSRHRKEVGKEGGTDRGGLVGLIGHCRQEALHNVSNFQCRGQI